MQASPPPYLVILIKMAALLMYCLFIKAISIARRAIKSLIRIFVQREVLLGGLSLGRFCASWCTTRDSRHPVWSSTTKHIKISYKNENAKKTYFNKRSSCRRQSPKYIQRLS